VSAALEEPQRKEDPFELELKFCLTYKVCSKAIPFMNLYIIYGNLVLVGILNSRFCGFIEYCYHEFCLHLKAFLRPPNRFFIKFKF
jgi:hypothetical protein